MKGPLPNELEVSLFGPGYGESAVIHLGGNEWIIIDCCRVVANGDIVPLEYLRGIGVDPATAVKLVVATHWHDDHIRGLSDVVRTCVSARTVCASALTKPEFIAWVTRYEARNSIAAGSGVKEIFEVLKILHDRGQQPIYAAPNRALFVSDIAAAVVGGNCIVTSLSPSDRQQELFWHEIAALVPGLEPKRRAVSQSRNHVAVVLWVQAGNNLYCSDLTLRRRPMQERDGR